MVTKQKLIDVANKRGYKVDVVLVDEKRPDLFLVGLNMGKGVWHWWMTIGTDNTAFFDHSYSQNNGRRYGGIMRGLRVERGLGLF